MTMILYSSWHL